ncbi:MAG: hypothetical protein K1X64_18930, partial [Myxococcaceae bacterium]|nr:hypothetical protein [Myxococcaceae bacterium]
VSLSRLYGFAAVLIALGSSCTTQGRMLRGATVPAGEMRVFPAEPEAVLAAATKAGIHLRLRVQNEHSAEHFRLLRSGVGGYTWGSYVTLNVQRLPSGNTALWVDEGQALKTTVLAPRVTEAVFTQTAEKLGLFEGVASEDEAPTSPTGSVLASLLATAAGWGLLSGNIALWVHQSPQRPVPLAVMTAVSSLLIVWGPGFGDLLNGEWKRFVFGGLFRLTSLNPLLGWLGGAGPSGASLLPGFGFVGLMVNDIVDAQNAPQRWRYRRTAERLRERGDVPREIAPSEAG